LGNAGLGFLGSGTGFSGSGNGWRVFFPR
jgi:hypothetical protein